MKGMEGIQEQRNITVSWERWKGKTLKIRVRRSCKKNLTEVNILKTVKEDPTYV